MTRLFLIRHGESVAQVEGFMSGHNSCRGLSDLGRRQVEALRDRLARTREIEADVLLTSILPRAIETAEIISPAVGGHAPIRDCGLCEIHIGEGDGLVWDEIERRWPRPERADPAVSTIPGAESWLQFNERVAASLARHVEEHAGSTIVAAVHGGVIEGSLAALGGMEPTAIPAVGATNASITEWLFEVHPYRGGDPAWRLVRFNDAAHLADLPTSSS